MYPFVGVMGITKKEETKELLATGHFDQNRKLMAGVMVNEDMLSKRTPSLRNRFPGSFDQIPRIFCYDERVWNVVKCYWEDHNLSNKLFHLIDIIGKSRMDGIILPSYPHLKELMDFKVEYPDMNVILNVPRKDPDPKNDLQLLREKLETYLETRSINGILLDGNYYYSPEIDPLYTRDCLTFLADHHKDLYVGVEGVKDSEEIPKLRPALDPLPEAGIVIEDGARASDDILELNSTKKFIQQTVAH